jgi:hypothetical protein
MRGMVIFTRYQNHYKWVYGRNKIATIVVTICLSIINRTRKWCSDLLQEGNKVLVTVNSEPFSQAGTGYLDAFG